MLENTVQSMNLYTGDIKIAYYENDKRYFANCIVIDVKM